MSQPHAAYIRTEAAISMAINAVLSFIFFLLVFGFDRAVPVSGVGNYAFDFLPQSFAIGLMATLVPGAITASRLRAGKVAPSVVRSRLPASLLLRSIAMAGVAVTCGLVVAMVLSLIAAGAVIEAVPAAIAKIVYGGTLGAVITPIGLRRALYVPQEGTDR